MMKKLLCEKGLEKEKSESILDWAKEVEVSFEETSERLNEEIVEDRVCRVNKVLNTMDDMGFFEEHMNLSLYLLFSEDSYVFFDYHLSGYGIKRLNRSCLALPYPRRYVS